MPTISVIIVNWNSKDHVRNYLLSLDRHCSLGRQTIVVDGASYDGCDTMLAREFPDVEFVQSRMNPGFGGSNNLGAASATGDYLLLLNPDTEIRKGAVESMLDAYDSDSRVGLVGAKLLNTDGSLQMSCVQSFPTPLNRALDSAFLRRLLPASGLWGNAEAFSSGGPVDVDAVSGACMLLSRQAFEDVGGFCHDYFMYAEDIQLCWDVSRRGGRIVFQPRAVVTHHGGGASGGEFKAFSTIEMNQSVHQFILHRQGFAAGAIYRALMAVSSVGRLAVMAVGCTLVSRRNRPLAFASLRKWWTTLCWSVRPLRFGRSKQIS